MALLYSLISRRRSVLNLALFYIVLVFLSPFRFAITSLMEERANLSCFLRLFDVHLFVYAVSSSSWCLGKAAAFLDDEVPRRTSYGVYISQLIRFTRASSNHSDFNCRKKALVPKP